MKLYNKPELNVEKFDVEDIITEGSTPGNNTVTDGTIIDGLSAGMEFDISDNGNEF